MGRNVWSEELKQIKSSVKKHLCWVPGLWPLQRLSPVESARHMKLNSEIEMVLIVFF